MIDWIKGFQINVYLKTGHAESPPRYNTASQDKYVAIFIINFLYNLYLRTINPKSSSYKKHDERHDINVQVNIAIHESVKAHWR